MIEKQTMLRWTHELVAFANGSREEVGVSSLFNASDFDAEDHAVHGLPYEDEPRTEQAADALRTKVKKALALLAPLNHDAAPADTTTQQRRAAKWLDDLVEHAPHPLLTTDGIWTMSPPDKKRARRLQVAPRFRSTEARYAATFAELIQEDAPALIKRCLVCDRLYVYERGPRGQPRKYCDQHYEEFKAKHYKKGASAK